MARTQHARLLLVRGGPREGPMTKLEYAGGRLANAVAVWLQDRDAAALTGVKLALSEYRETEASQ